MRHQPRFSGERSVASSASSSASRERSAASPCGSSRARELLRGDEEGIAAAGGAPPFSPTTLSAVGPSRYAPLLSSSTMLMYLRRKFGEGENSSDF